MDERYLKLCQWLHDKYVDQRVLSNTQHELSKQLTPLQGDASQRRYFRWDITPQRSVIAVDAPPEVENTTAFVAIARQWQLQGIPVPEIFFADSQQGFLLIEDLGDQQLLPLLNQDNAQYYYGQAFNILQQIQQSTSFTGYSLPAYDQTFLQRELDLFHEWFVVEFLKIELNAIQKKMLQGMFEQIIDCALQQPQVVVHRDFHARNLMITNNAIRVIDFQGAVQGPATYDAVSLLKDCYICWPIDQVKQWWFDWSNSLMALKGFSSEQTWQWFQWMGLQRHLKVLGLFVRLFIRENKARYLQDLPLVVNYVEQVILSEPDFADIADWWQDELQPRWLSYYHSKKDS
ncbi:aminoglycoside phosphotransferase family protein [Zooshikella sp. RANM57]|uniref:aminoglycoside phosphotransferase family protein n=1 Tax=Zooshikella sp. RANM57 TaxID=3425863 RepID=UPI003D6E541F